MTKHLMIGAAAAATILGASGAQAAAVYSADATTTLTLVSVTNTTTPEAGDSEFGIAILTSLDQEGSDTTGDATASTDFTLDPFEDGFGVIQNGLAAGETLSNGGSVTGTAADGTSDAFVSTAGEMSFTNLSLTDTFEVTFELGFDLFASASVDNAMNESASAIGAVLAEASLFGDVTGTVERDGISTALSNVVLDLALEATGADGTLADAGSLLLTFVVAPGAGVDMFMFADVLGGGVGVADIDMNPNPIPLPGALGFMLVGAAGLAGLRKRKAA